MHRCSLGACCHLNTEINIGKGRIFNPISGERKDFMKAKGNVTSSLTPMKIRGVITVKICYFRYRHGKV